MLTTMLLFDSGQHSLDSYMLDPQRVQWSGTREALAVQLRHNSGQ